MKRNTIVVLGIRSVGEKDKEPFIESMNVVDALKKIAVFTFENSMAQRFQFVMGRTPEDVMVGLGLTQQLKNQRLTNRAMEITGFLDELFDDSDAPAGGQAAELAFKPGLPTRTLDDQAQVVDDLARESGR